MEIIYKRFNEEDMSYDDFLYINFKKLNHIILNRTGNFSIVINTEENVKCSLYISSYFVVTRVIDYIMDAYIKKIKILDITEFVKESEKLETQIKESEKKKKELLKQRREQAKDGLSFPEYEFMEGALSFENDKVGGLSLGDE